MDKFGKMSPRERCSDLERESPTSFATFLHWTLFLLSSSFQDFSHCLMVL
ncbi:unnamed protein product, partial [Vitis vinifera]